MREISANELEKVVCQMCLQANRELPRDVLFLLNRAMNQEKGRAKRVLERILENCKIAKREELPLCQDTGLAIVFAEIGQKVVIKGDLKRAIEKGIEKGWKQGLFREAIVHPLKRDNPTSLPPVIHFDFLPGEKVKITLLCKGFGSENVSRTCMFLPHTRIEDIEEWVVGIVKEKGVDACPPLFIGIGIGGSVDKAVFLSKKALLQRVDRITSDPERARIEKRILRKVNRLGIGPLGLGGNSTALAVKVLFYPTHIAGLPVAVNINCWALRRVERVI